MLGIYSLIQPKWIPQDQNNQRIHSLDREMVFTIRRRLSPKRRLQNFSTPSYRNLFQFRSLISGIYSLIEPLCITESQKIQQIYF